MTLTPLFARKLLTRIMVGRRRISRKSRRLESCIFKLDRIGDFILAVSAIRELTRHYQERNCALVVYQSVADLAKKEFPQATIISLSLHDGGIKNALQLFATDSKQFTHYEFENLICLRYQRTLVHHLVLSWIHAERSIGFTNSTDAGIFQPDENNFQFPFAETLPLPNVPSHNLCTELERHKTIVSRILEHEISSERILPLLSSIQPTPGNYLIVTPLSSQLIKDYPEAALLAALKQIRDGSSVPIAISGALFEQARLARIVASATSLGIHNVTLQIPNSLPDFVALIAGARAVLTVDTAAAHFATAMDKPAVVILGGGHFGHFGPWYRSSKQTWLTNQVPCFGCDWKCVHFKPLCITEIPPSETANAVLEVLK